MDDLKNNDEFIKEYNIVSNRPNFKNFIAFRKDVKNNKINNSYCIVESENKKISFDLIDNDDFFDKENLKINIKAIKEKIDSRVNSAKNRTNNNIWKNIHLITEEKENIISSSNHNDNDLNKKEITEKIIKSNSRSIEPNNKICQEFENKDINFENSSSNETKAKGNLASNGIGKSSIFNKNPVSIFPDAEQEKDDYPLNHAKDIEKVRNLSEIAINDNTDEKDKFKKINEELRNVHLRDKQKALSLTNNFNKQISNKNTLNDLNKSENVDYLYRNNYNEISLNKEVEKYIYESVYSSNNKIKHDKNNSERENLIENINSHDKYNLLLNTSNKIFIESKENKNEDFSLKKLDFNDEFSGSKINNYSLRNVKMLCSEENINISSQENMNPNKEVFNLNNKKMLKKTITIINAPVPKLDCDKEDLHDPIGTENFNEKTKYHLNFNKKTSNKHIDNVIGKNSYRSKGQKSEEKLGTQCNVTIEENSIIYPFQFCYICDNLNQIDFVYNSETCNHSICYKCLKSFLENKIEQNDLWTKCPIFTCKGNYSLEMIKKLISDYHYKQMQLASSNTVSNNNNINLIKNRTKESGEGRDDREDKHLFKNNPKERNDSGLKENNINEYFNSPHLPFNMRSGIHNENDLPTNLHSNIKSYSKKNFVEVNNLDNFFCFNKNREIYCKKCNEASLFLRPGKNLAKCLNCFTTFCKYCLKPITFDHFDLNSFNYCKVYFRRKLKTLTLKNNNLNKFKNGIISFLMIVASYLILFISCFYLLSKVLKKILNIDAFGSKVNYFYFINKNNYKKYEYIKCFFEAKNYQNENAKEDEIKPENKNLEKAIAPKLINNLIININKKEDFSIKHESLKIQQQKNNDDDLINLKFHLPIENENPNINSFIGDFRLLDKNLFYLIKSKIETRRSINKLRIRKIVSNPDNRGAFYFYDINENENENHFRNKRGGFNSENIIDNYRKMKFSDLLKDLFLLKIIRYLGYYLLFIISGPILLFLLLFIIPFFPLLILIFQI